MASCPQQPGCSRPAFIARAKSTAFAQENVVAHGWAKLLAMLRHGQLQAMQSSTPLLGAVPGAGGDYAGASSARQCSPETPRCLAAWFAGGVPLNLETSSVSFRRTTIAFRGKCWKQSSAQLRCSICGQRRFAKLRILDSVIPSNDGTQFDLAVLDSSRKSVGPGTSACSAHRFRRGDQM